MTYQSQSDIEYDWMHEMLDEPRNLPQSDLDWMSEHVKDGISLPTKDIETLNRIRAEWEGME